MSDPSNNLSNYTITDVSNVGISGEGVAAPHNRVTINLHINVDVQGNVDIFTASGEAMKNVVVCTNTLDVSGLYSDPSNSSIKLYEPSVARGYISGNVAADFSGSTLFTTFATSMQNVVQGVIDASGAAPFSTYTNVKKVQEFNSFGDLVLSLYAHYIFGHAAATAAIDNDVNLVAYMNNAEGHNDLSGADIGNRLARALADLSPEVVSSIVGQIQAQDPSRTRGLDNNQDKREAVIFAPGDIVFVQITVEEPSLTVGPVGGGEAAGVNKSGAPGSSTLTNLVGSAYPAEKPFVTLQITLAAAGSSSPAPAPSG
jgi:hypothetical protein